MATDLGDNSLQAWLPQAVTIVNLGLAPPVAQAADYWGRRFFLLASVVPALVGSIILSRATSMKMALAGNVLASISTASQPLLFAIASEIIPRQHRPAAQAGINGAFAIGAVTALLMGSAVNRDYHEGWRIVWYTNIGLFAIAGLITFLFYNPPPRVLQLTLTQREKFKRLDWVGICVLPVGVTLFVVGLTWSDNPYSWTNAHILAPFLIGCVILVGLVIYEVRFKKYGIFHRDLFTNDRNFAIAIFAILVEGVTFFAANNFFPLEISVLFETDPVMVGLRFSVAFLASFTGGFIASVYCSWNKQIRWPLVASFLCFSIFNGMRNPKSKQYSQYLQSARFVAGMISIDLGSSKAVWAYTLFLGLGLGGCLTLVVVAAQFSAPPALISLSSGLLIAFRSLGASVGLPVYGAIFNSQLTKKLPADIAAEVLPLGLSPNSLPSFIAALSASNHTALATVPGVTPEIIRAGAQGLKTAYLKSFRAINITALALSIIAVISEFHRRSNFPCV